MSLRGDNSTVEAVERSVQVFVTAGGKRPFPDWISSLTDKRARARIYARIDRLRLGNFGDCRSVGGGVYELRGDEGPGYRVYFGILGRTAVLLLCGGSKKEQNRDIEKAREYWREFQRNAH